MRPWLRIAVLAAAALARTRNDAIREPDLLLAAAAEYRKLGKTLPAGLAAPPPGPRNRLDDGGNTPSSR